MNHKDDTKFLSALECPASREILLRDLKKLRKFQSIGGVILFAMIALFSIIQLILEKKADVPGGLLLVCMINLAGAIHCDMKIKLLLLQSKSPDRQVESPDP